MNLRTAGPTLVLVLLAVFATAFAFINYNNSVKIWPLQSLHPLTLVIGIALGLGAGVGGLLVHLIHHKRLPAADAERITAATTGAISNPKTANRL